jgi:hypothetical protein
MLNVVTCSAIIFLFFSRFNSSAWSTSKTSISSSDRLIPKAARSLTRAGSILSLEALLVPATQPAAAGSRPRVAKSMAALTLAVERLVEMTWNRFYLINFGKKLRLEK